MKAKDSDRLISRAMGEEDTAELKLRPLALDDFVGQKQVRETLAGTAAKVGLLLCLGVTR